MIKSGFILTRLLLLFLTITLIDGGKCILVADSKIHNVITHDAHGDSEVPDHNPSSLSDDKWVDADQDRMDLTSMPVQKVIPEFSPKTRDFPISIWQPPKSS